MTDNVAAGPFTLPIGATLHVSSRNSGVGMLSIARRQGLVVFLHERYADRAAFDEPFASVHCRALDAATRDSAAETRPTIHADVRHDSAERTAR